MTDASTAGLSNDSIGVNINTRLLMVCALSVAAIAWLILPVFTVPTIFKGLMYLVVAVAWGCAARLSYREDRSKTLLVSTPTAQARRINLAVFLTGLVWLICIVFGLDGWRLVNAVFAISIGAVVMVWTAKSIAHTASTSGPFAASKSANKLMKIAFIVATIVWLLPICPSTSGPSWFKAILYLINAGMWFYAGIESRHQDTYAVRPTYIASGVSVFTFLLCIFTQAPHWRTVLLVFVVNVILAVIVLTAKMMADRAIKTGFAAEQTRSEAVAD